MDLASVTFTQKYLTDFEKANSQSKDSAELINKMETLYPSLDDKSSLEFSAKVVKGEMQWPQ
jgi:hypothetical protein